MGDQTGLCGWIGNWVSNFLQTILHPSVEVAFYVEQWIMHGTSGWDDKKFMELNKVHWNLSPNGYFESYKRGREGQAVSDPCTGEIIPNGSIPSLSRSPSMQPLLSCATS
jgi:hypothetical protein